MERLNLPLVESKTWTYHRRVGLGRTAGRGGVGQDRVLIELRAQETRDARIFEIIEDMTLERPSRSTNKRKPV